MQSQASQAARIQNLTLTSVVFESYTSLFIDNTSTDLTLTSVVFELKSTKISIIHLSYLTLTSVVFELQKTETLME